MSNDDAMKILPDHWFESNPGKMICSNHPTEGVIIDYTIVSGEWFVIFNNPKIEMLEHYTSRIEAVKAFLEKLQEFS